MEHHARGLLRASGDPELVRALRADPRTAPLDPARRAMLDYVCVLTETPWRVRRTHVEAMRAQGFSDEAIAVVNFVACFFAWCNRAVDGLGVPLEGFWEPEVRERVERAQRSEGRQD